MAKIRLKCVIEKPAPVDGETHNSIYKQTSFICTVKSTKLLQESLFVRVFSGNSIEFVRLWCSSNFLSL